VSRLSRFDRAALLVALGAIVLVILVVWWSGRAGVRITGLAPADGAESVSTRAVLEITFAEAIAPAEAPLSFQPPMDGATRWEGNRLIFTPAGAWQAETTYQVTLREGLLSQQGRSLRPTTWRFTTRRAQALYLGPDGAGYDQLFVVPAGGGPPTPLTAAPLGVWDYSVAPDGSAVASSVWREDGGTDLWLLPVGEEPGELLACPAAACSGASWLAGGPRLVDERREMSAPGAPPGMPRLWWLAPESGETLPVFEDNQALGMAARWPSTGEWLSFVSPAERGVQLYNVADGSSFVVYSEMGEPAAWSPDGRELVMTALRSQGERFAVHLLKVSLAGQGATEDLTGDLEVEDGAPEWSPDGEWIAFGRKVARAAVGKQIWLMRPDGGEAHALTAEPDVFHGPPHWSPDGRTLLYQRYRVSAPTEPPEIWLLEVSTGEQRRLAANGIQPAWLP
jgi:TolB protein